MATSAASSKKISSDLGLSFATKNRLRKSYGKLREVSVMPNLIHVQRESFNGFLQIDTRPDKRTISGLQEVFQSVFPIRDFAGKSELEFVKYEFEFPKFDEEECRQRDLTFGAPLKVTFRLIIWDVDEESGSRTIRDIKEQDVYMGDIPLMTGDGTFIVNGTERVIVSQMQRSPGVFFDHDKGKTHASGKFLYSARVIPYRGSWLDFEFDPKDLINVRIDRRRKLPVTTMLLSLDNPESAKLRAEAKESGDEIDSLEIKGYTAEELLNFFYASINYKRADKGWKAKFDLDAFKGKKLTFDLVDAKSGKTLAAAGTKLNARQLKKLDEEGMKEYVVSDEELFGQYVANDMINPSTGEVLFEAGDEIDKDLMAVFTKNNIKDIKVLDIDYVNVGGYLLNSLKADKNRTREEALMDIYRVMRPGEPPTLETADALFNSLFFDIERYDLSAVGRVKMNSRLGFPSDDSQRTLRSEDVLAIVKHLIDIKDGRGDVDDIDHLGNRRVRSVGELMENQFRIGLLRMERAVKERMSSVDADTVMPQDLINAKPVIAAMREFFGSSQLSQFMDQTNPLSEITHKRRLSALGPGGLTRERAGFEVRDVHPTHYGRICPIETPEGPNIGLINSLATFAQVNRYGFIETPYRKVANGKVSDEVIYMSAMDEGKFTIAQANATLDKDGKFTADLISARRNGDYIVSKPEEIDLIDVSPKQLVSVAASLIPFLENDDANRALMGSNMQRQAVPLIKTEAPFVGTGMEGIVARDSGATTIAKRGGIIDQVDSTRIVIRVTDEVSDGSTGVDIYNLRKFQRSNQNTAINQRPIVQVGDIVKAGDIVADGSSTDLGELALGRNVLVAFMPWNGYNFEDSILISERIVSDDVFTSIHIEEFEVVARDTKLGPEEITRDIPNVGEEALRNLDEAGIIFVGAEVGPGDILVGKVTPKGESPSTPEEKLLRAIFGEKASDVRDTSLRVPPGTAGTIVDVRIFSRRGLDKDERALAIEQSEIERLKNDRDAEKAIIDRNLRARLLELMVGQTVEKGTKTGPKSGAKLSEENLAELTPGQWRQIVVKDAKVADKVEALSKAYDETVEKINLRFEDKVEKVRAGDEMAPGMLKMVKVFIATKRKLQPGDKMAGRHGNKGVVSKIVPCEDMPFLEDGRPVDIVLNPLGVPSRMNVGQILETHLGWACGNLGKQVRELVSNLSNQKDTSALRGKLKDVYGQEVYSQLIASLKDEEIIELSKNLSNGVPIATPVFDGAHEADINEALQRAGVTESGQVQLIDGRTGEKFDRKVTVGWKYLLKLHHLVDDKIHARSIGPYSLVTQQPLGGKAQFGGQRFGEMEVWALEAYGAAYTLQEILTVKSDDVAGRTKVYEAIVRGEENFESGIPESFNVLVKEMRALGLNVDLVNSEK